MIATWAYAEGIDVSETVDASKSELTTSVSDVLDATAPLTNVTVTATISDTPYIKESDATLELLTHNGVPLNRQTMHISRDTKMLVFTFAIPEFEIGTSFKVRAVDGLHTIQYYDKTYYTGADITFPTYYYVDADGNNVTSTDIAITINPLFDKSIENLYYNAEGINQTGARVINGNAMIPARTVGEFIGFDVSYNDQHNAVALLLDGKYMFFNVDNTYATIFGNDIFAPEKTVMIDGTVYIPLRTFADAIGSELEVKDYGTHLDINIKESAMVKEYYDRLPINKMNVASRTNYMVWVSLSEYKTRVYKGHMNHWRPILEATCAIGAPGTPSVTGSFEYNYKTRWDYGTYYVGPCLVFYRGYALHSVLLNQNGTEYDGRVGMQLSHGCIRLKKKDIDFIANTIPVGTKIYITP